MGPALNKTPGETTADFAGQLASSNPYVATFAKTLDPNSLGSNVSDDVKQAMAYLHDVGLNSDQNAQELQLYQKAMLDNQTKMRQTPGRQGTILTGDPLTPTPNFNPTSIL